jgi:hypothetical protein
MFSFAYGWGLVMASGLAMFMDYMDTNVTYAMAGSLAVGIGFMLWDILTDT